MMKIKELELLKKGIAKEEAKIELINEKIKKMQESMIENCKHPKKYLIENSRYFSGDYYNTNYTEYTTQCTLCGESSKPATEYHGCFG